MLVKHPPFLEASFFVPNIILCELQDFVLYGWKECKIKSSWKVDDSFKKHFKNALYDEANKIR
jgi:hypothetical protein